ncbi:MAG TPA: hypothetical protein VME43_23115 [Bryobacteraceae bacterium]|nr:hypothetical protein [Bryobacteraceae bacterium]
MTADKPQRHAYRMNGKPSRAFPGSAVGANGANANLPRAHCDPRVDEAAVRFPLRESPLPSHGKLAGFGGSTNAEIQSPSAPIPIWFAALLASRCQAKAGGQDRDVRWDCISGWAVYTNRGAETETIEPLGVCLEGGHTVAVSWIPGETAYTVEVFRQFDCVV